MPITEHPADPLPLTDLASYISRRAAVIASMRYRMISILKGRIIHESIQPVRSDLYQIAAADDALVALKVRGSAITEPASDGLAIRLARRHETITEASTDLLRQLALAVHPSSGRRAIESHARRFADLTGLDDRGMVRLASLEEPALVIAIAPGVGYDHCESLDVLDRHSQMTAAWAIQIGESRLVGRESTH